MNDGNLKFSSEKDNTYHATANLNTAIENPQININSAIEMNIQNSDDNNNFDPNFVDNNYNQSFVNNSMDLKNNDDINQNQFNNDMNVDNNFSNNSFINSSENMIQNDNINLQSKFIFNDNNKEVAYTNEESLDSITTNNMSYEPTLKEKKKPDSGLEISRELKGMMFIVFILFLFILVIPYIYDFFQNLESVVTTR